MLAAAKSHAAALVRLRGPWAAFFLGVYIEVQIMKKERNVVIDAWNETDGGVN